MSSAAAPPYPITAYGLCNSLGRQSEEVIARLATSRSGLRPCSLKVPFETVTGHLEDPLPLPDELTTFDSRTTRLAMLAFDEVASSVQRAVQKWGADRVAVVVGTSTGGLAETERAYDTWRTTGAFPDSYSYTDQHLFDSFARALKIRAGIEGPLIVVSTACSSSGKVFGSAQRLLMAGLADAVLVGGVDSLCQTTLRGFYSLGVLAAQHCRPFGQDRPGMNIGEGAALLLLEKEGAAPVWLLGVGESSDGFHMSSPHPEGRGAVLAMQRALRPSGCQPSQIDHVNAHGTGTMRNDMAESRAICSLLGADVPVVSTKSYTGHLLGAAAATEAVLTIVAIEQGWLPASLGAVPIDTEVTINVVQKRREAPCRYALSNSFAFGGNNVSLLFGARS